MKCRCAHSGTLSKLALGRPECPLRCFSRPASPGKRILNFGFPWSWRQLAYMKGEDSLVQRGMTDASTSVCKDASTGGVDRLKRIGWP